MRLANRALFAALVTLVLCAAVSAQTLRPESDPRNQSPTVGTGGPPGGPTGLFTIYDGSTIRKGEFTFSVAYSNYDRDPGNVDITDRPFSFNVGLNDHVELFFKTNAYRGIKVNNPQNLSSFYLPNVGTCGAAFCSLPAIVLAPSGPLVGTLSGLTIFRPFNNQPFVRFPFVGGSAGNYQQGPGAIGTLFGWPGNIFNAQLGAPFGGGGNHGQASFFPGMGSGIGSILPGIVLSTAVLPCTALTGGCIAGNPVNPINAIVVPTSFTTQPTYLPDAPFISRQYGESSFTDFTIGAKIRLTDPRSPLGIAIIPFYRWYPDSANDAGGFNQLQRGASPGGEFLHGDLGVVGAVDARLSTHANVSANIGYIWNSNPTSSALGGATLLDRPDEVLAGVGFDFPVNKHFQPIAEVRSTYYRGGTPNAFHNNPVEVLGGVKIYPKRWFGFGVSYRRALNQQDQKHFNLSGNVTTVAVNNLSGVFVPGRGIVIVPGTAIAGTATTGVPLGYKFSGDANGFIVQAWAGRRNARSVPDHANYAPTVSVSSSSSSITTPCPEGTSSTSCNPSASWQVQLMADGKDPENDTLLYSWSVTGGKINGQGKDVSWDLTGANAGTYTATVEVNDGNNHTAHASTTVTIAVCSACMRPPCPTIDMSSASDVEQGAPATFTASVSGNVTYNWSVSAGTITSGQGTSSITVDTANLGGQTVTATVEVGGLAPECGKTTSRSTAIRTKAEPPSCKKLDEYGNIKFNDEKARLDAYASALQGAPGSEGVILAYGTCEGEGMARGNRAKDYLVNTRGIDAGRITVMDGGCRGELLVQLFVCEQGAVKPMASTDGAVSPCPACKVKKKAPARHKVRHGKKKATDDDDDEE